MPNNLGYQYSLHAAECEKKAIDVLCSGWYILEKEISAFEKEWAEFCAGFLVDGYDTLQFSDE